MPLEFPHESIVPDCRIISQREFDNSPLKTVMPSSDAHKKKLIDALPKQIDALLSLKNDLLELRQLQPKPIKQLIV